MVCTYRAYGYITMKKYDLAVEDLEQAEALKSIETSAPSDGMLDPISKFNLSLTSMLKIKPSPIGIDPFLHLTDGHEKLQKVVEISRQFPENKDMIRYHAIYLVQQQILYEVNSHKRANKNQFKI